MMGDIHVVVISCSLSMVVGRRIIVLVEGYIAVEQMFMRL